ncbi:MAG: hypothetical protein L3J69_01250 [Desulfobacula sp.]|nr:hypothetical protein [Desulfobacula sp.]
MDKQDLPTISFSIDKDNIFLFFSILQQGFMVSATVGCSLKSLICDQWGVTPDYLSGRISTIFLNNQPVDDVESAIVNDGAILALSGAMPGLVGATFRKGGVLSIFRSSITHENIKVDIDLPAKGTITLKLFNLLVSEMGPAFLERGFWITAGVLYDFVDTKKTNLLSVLKSVSVNGNEIEFGELSSLEKYNDEALINVIVLIEK